MTEKPAWQPDETLDYDPPPPVAPADMTLGSGARLPAPTAPAAHPLVQGRCPACNGSSLFLGTGGHVTCSRLDCPNPTLADDQLHRGRPDTQLHDAIECAIGLNVDCGGTQGVHQVRDAVLTAIEEHLDIGDAEAWCKICRRVWDGKAHQCEGDAEQRLAAVHDALAAFADRGVIRIGHTNLDIPTAGEVIDAVRAALDQPTADTATGATGGTT